MSARRIAWVAATLVVLAGPVALTVGRLGRDEPVETLLVTVGVIALVTMAVAVAVPSRLRSLTAAFGIDRVVGAHRVLGLVAIAAVLVHVGTRGVARGPDRR